MKINNKDNFITMMARMISGLGYENVKEHNDKVIDITAEKNGEKYCFKCKYEIDAVGGKYIDEFYDAAANGGYDKLVFITNSSFLSSAKKSAEQNGIDLWDRNTVDRLYIGVHDNIEDRPVEEQGGNGVVIGIAIAVVVVAVAAIAYFLFK